MKKVSSGIIPLDAQLGGGFPIPSIILVLEEPGAGADVLSLHFAIEGVKNKENVAYMLTNDTEEELNEDIKTYFGLNPKTLSEMKIIELVPLKLFEKVRCTKSILKVVKSDPFNLLRKNISSGNYSRIVLNNLTYFFMNYDENDVLKLLNEIALFSRKNKFTLLALMTKGMFEPRLETAVKHVVDGVIELTIKEVENEIQRRLKILKLKRVLVPKIVMRYDLTDRGIKLETVVRVV